jgi:predicted GNAT superfamily acetyltransferase
VLIKRVSKIEEIEGIKRLQTANLRKNLSKEEIEKEGFVTAEYTLEFLELMNRIEPSIIAVQGDNLVGYAMVATKALLGRHKLLDDLFSKIDSFIFKGHALKKRNYVVVGQLCVAKSHRGKGISKKMYDFYKSVLSEKFEYCLTDVQISNPGSIKAHLKSGFQILGDLSYGGADWKIVIWDWQE